jgi:hypothetical protein
MPDLPIRPHFKNPGRTERTRQKAHEFNTMADGVGFEPTVRLHARRFSRPVP